MSISIFVGIASGVLMVVIFYGLARGFRLIPGDFLKIVVASLSVLISVAVMVILVSLSNLGLVEILVLLVILAIAGALATELVGRERLLPVLEGNKTQTKPIRAFGGTGWGKPSPTKILREKGPKVGFFARMLSKISAALREQRKERSEKLISESFDKIGSGKLEEGMEGLRKLRESETDPAVLMRTYINLAWLQKNLGNRAGAIIELQHAFEYAKFIGDERLTKDILKMIREMAYQ